MSILQDKEFSKNAGKLQEGLNKIFGNLPLTMREKIVPGVNGGVVPEKEIVTDSLVQTLISIKREIANVRVQAFFALSLAEAIESVLPDDLVDAFQAKMFEIVNRENKNLDGVIAEIEKQRKSNIVLGKEKDLRDLPNRFSGKNNN